MTTEMVSTEATVSQPAIQPVVETTKEDILVALKPQLEGLVLHLFEDLLPLVQRTQTMVLVEPKAPKVREHHHVTQPEKLLSLLMTGKPITIPQLNKSLDKRITRRKLSVGLWQLKKMGSKIVRQKKGRKIISLQLMNPKEMQSHLHRAA